MLEKITNNLKLHINFLTNQPIEYASKEINKNRI